MRLVKYLAHAGVASRRASELIIADGRVTVNGRVVTDPARDVHDELTVKVDGKRIKTETQTLVVYLVNKPAGYVSTAKDPQDRQTVVSLVPSSQRLYPVGRLDYDTTGVILLTNDGDLAHKLTHPSFEVPRTYRARVANPPVHEPALRALREGVLLEDGMTAPAMVRKISSGYIELTIHEGRKRQVKRMLEAVGHRVYTLERVAFGPLRIGSLQPGEFRKLGQPEVERLRELGCMQAGMRVVALRGANEVKSNTAEDILAATDKLMREILERNQLAADDLVSCIFTLTPDLDAQFPAAAARAMGLSSVPLLCAREIPVPGALPKIIRVMIHAYMDRPAEHVYLGEAAKLRLDLAGAQ